MNKIDSFFVDDLSSKQSGWSTYLVMIKFAIRFRSRRKVQIKKIFCLDYCKGDGNLPLRCVKNIAILMTYWKLSCSTLSERLEIAAATPIFVLWYTTHTGYVFAFLCGSGIYHVSSPGNVIMIITD